MLKTRIAALAAALFAFAAPSQASAVVIQLQDNFDTTGAINDDLGTRQAGSWLPPTGYDSNSFLTFGGTNQILSNELLLNNGIFGGNAQVTIQHDFVDPSILTFEGFTMSFEVDPDITSTATSSNYFGLAIGQSSSSAGIGVPDADSSTDFGMRLAGNGTFFITRGGSAFGIFDGAPSTNKVYQFDLTVATTSFAAGNTATISLFIDNSPLDINGPSAGNDLTITWDGDGENYITLVGGGAGTLLDNLQIAPIPEPASCSMFATGILGLFAVRRQRKSRR